MEGEEARYRDEHEVKIGNFETALAKLERGTYGTCSKCGNEIGDARLEFRPESIYCVSCKSAG